MNFRSISVLFSFALVTVLAAGCGDDAAPAQAAECIAIVDRCHAFDTGSGPAHDCHAFGEAAGRTAAECTAMQSTCFAICTAPADAGGAGTDGGGAGTDGGSAGTDGGGAGTDGSVATDAGGGHGHDAG